MSKIKTDTVKSITRDFIGRDLDPGREHQLSENLSLLIKSIDKSTERLPFESEPIGFTSILEKYAEEK
tara:strand:+ start:348 stop:551 length:204 start_codon:yes stop_codon:yes gene_type:complete